MGCKSSKAVDVASNEPFDAPKNGYRAADIPIGGAPVGKGMSSPKTAAATNTKAEEPVGANNPPSAANQVQIVVSEGTGASNSAAGGPNKGAANDGHPSTTTNSANTLPPPQTPSQPAAASAQAAAAEKDQKATTPDAAAAAGTASAEDQEEIITGVLEKRGAVGTAGQLRWTERYVVLNAGIMTYHKSVADYEANKPPRKNNRVDLRMYAVIAGEPPESEIIDPTRAGKARNPDFDYSRAFYLRPLPFEGCPTRTWEFRAVELEDLADWIAVFQEQGCASEQTYQALVAAGKQGIADVIAAVATTTLGATHPLVTEKRAFVAPLPPAEAVAAATASEKAAAAAAAAASGKAVDGTSVPEAGGSSSASSALVGVGAEASSSAAVDASSSGVASSSLPYNSCNMVLTPALTSDLCDPSTDSQDPHAHAAYLKKKGEKALDGYKSRWVVLKRGFMMYWDAEAKRARGSRPNHGNYIPLAAYNIVIPSAKDGLFIRLDPIKGGPADGATPSLNNNTGADSANVKGRVWDLQVVGKTEADRQFWVDKLIRHGAIRGGQMPAAAGATAGSASTAAGAVAGEPAVAIAANGYDYRTRPHIWEVCEAPDGRLYFYNLKYDASQWDLPTSDELSEAEANTLKQLAAAGAAR